MLKLFDRHLFYSYLKSYMVCLVSLLGLYIVVDLFTNLDDFLQNKAGVGAVMFAIFKFYSCKIAQIFDQLSQAIVLLAGMFTISWMQRNNEILPLLSAGVSVRRIVRPVLIAACAMLGLSVLNQEIILPRVDGFLVEYRNEGDRPVDVKGGYDRNGVHITGGRANKKDVTIFEFFCRIPSSVGNDNYTTLQAREARYIPPENQQTHTGGWMLIGSSPREIEGWSRTDILEMVDPGKFFLKTDLDFDTVTRSKNWFTFVNTYDLFQELNRPGNSRLGTLAVLFHMRLTRPILGLILVFMGLSIILRDQNRNIFISAGLCLVICAVFFVACFFCRYSGDHGVLSPPMAAWLPVLSFGPLSFVMFDAVHT